MKNQVTIYVYGSCHFSERLDTDEAVGNGGYGVVITSNEQRVEEFANGSQIRQMLGWIFSVSSKD